MVFRSAPRSFVGRISHSPPLEPAASDSCLRTRSVTAEQPSWRLSGRRSADAAAETAVAKRRPRKNAAGKWFRSCWSRKLLVLIFGRQLIKKHPMDRTCVKGVRHGFSPWPQQADRVCSATSLRISECSLSLPPTRVRLKLNFSLK